MRYLIKLLIVASSLLNTAIAADFINEETRLKIFDKVVSELERIDGEGLPARNNRPEDWKTTLKILQAQVRTAQTPREFGQVFRKLDATYPNLHAQVVLDENFDIAAGRLRPTIAVQFGAEIVGPRQKNIQYKIKSIETEMMKDFKESNRPAVGDELLAINGKPMSEWSKENFIYCKFPLKEQCEMNFFDHFRKAFLSWNWNSPLEYTLRRNDRTLTTKIPVKSMTQGQNPSSNDCLVEPDRYEGFKPVYKGTNICAFESPTHPGVTVLSFARP